MLAGTATGTVESVYDAENHLTAATNGTRSSVYAYDADGDRAATSIDGTQTVYLPGGTELSLAGGQVTATRIYTYQGTAIARRTATTGSNRLAWQWSDGAGSEWQVAAADTPAPLARRADPFGGLRGPQPAGWSGDRGMAAGITDTVTGTLRLGARDYDPVTGTFTQPDPILDPTDPLQWNPYSYGAANPVDRPDPSGLAYCTSTACGGSPGSVGETGVKHRNPHPQHQQRQRRRWQSWRRVRRGQPVPRRGLQRRGSPPHPLHHTPHPTPPHRHQSPIPAPHQTRQRHACRARPGPLPHLPGLHLHLGHPDRRGHHRGRYRHRHHHRDRHLHRYPRRQDPRTHPHRPPGSQHPHTRRPVRIISKTSGIGRTNSE